MDWREYLVSDPQICGGELCATGTRVPVTVILDSLGEGSTVEAILASYPSLRPEHIQAALAHAANDFDQRMFWISDECFRRYGRRPTRFHALVAKLGGVGAAKRLLAQEKDSVAWNELETSQGDGFELTMEYVVIQDRYRMLFEPQDLKKAEERLAWFPNREVNRNYTYPI